MAGIERIVTALVERLDELAATTCDRIYREIPTYAQVPPADVSAAVNRNLSTAVAALRTGRVPAASALDGAAQTARERYAQGVPVQDTVLGFRISIALIHESFVDEALSRGLPVEATINGSRLLWEVADEFTTAIISGYHSLAVADALHDERRRIGHLHALLRGERGADLARLLPHGRWAAVRAFVTDPRARPALRSAIDRAGSTPGAAAIVVVDGDLVIGVVARPPRLAKDVVGEAAVALGAFGGVHDLPASDRNAAEILRVARTLGRTGVITADVLGWRLAMAERPDVVAAYRMRFLDPLRERGEYGAELAASVRAWLQCGTSIPATASRLHVHVNTVRHRLARYVELTGADLGDPDTIVGLWCVLEMPLETSTVGELDNLDERNLESRP